jgi:hypothetical protein
MRIAIYPENSSMNGKPVFQALIEHLRSKNEKVYIGEDKNCDVAIVWSVLWQGRMEPNRRVWEQFRGTGRPVVVLEVGGIRRNSSFKIAINGINREADFANDTFDDKRWPLFNHHFKPWKQTGNVIVICGQHTNSHQWREQPNMKAYFKLCIDEIRRYTDKPIIIRPHPRNIIHGFPEHKYKHVRVNLPKRDYQTYDDTDFKKILQSTWAVVNHSSNPAMEAVFSGIPVFVSEKSLCYDVGNKDLSDIMHPAMPARQNWANRLAYTEWFVEEFREGKPWARIRKRLLEKYIKQ